MQADAIMRQLTTPIQRSVDAGTQDGPREITSLVEAVLCQVFNSEYEGDSPLTDTEKSILASREERLRQQLDFQEETLVSAVEQGVEALLELKQKQPSVAEAAVKVYCDKQKLAF